MIVPILSGNIQVNEVCDCLRDYGIIVIETTRPHAKNITNEAIYQLGIDEDAEGGPKLIHLAAQVKDRGWSDFLMYTSVYDYVPDETQEIIVQAVLNWVAAGSPDKHLAHLTHHSSGTR